MTKIKVVAINNLTLAKKPVFSSFIAQSNYFKNLPAIFEGDKEYIPNGRFILQNIKDIETSTHVIVYWNDREIYYNVIDVKYTTKGNVELQLTLDNWLTYKYQNNLTLGAGYLERAKGTKPFYSKQVNPIKYTIGQEINLFPQIDNPLDENNPVTAQNDVGWLAVSVLDDSSPTQTYCKYFVYRIGGNAVQGDYLGRISLYALTNGSWYKNLPNNLTPDKVLGAWFLPFDFEQIVSGISTTLYNWTKNTGGSGNPTYWTNNGNPMIPYRTILGTFKSSTLQHFKISSPKGFNYYDIPIDLQFNNLKVTLDFSPTSARVLCYDGSYHNFQDANNAGCAVEIPCDMVDTILDTWTIYKNNQRDIDIEQANINLNKGLVSSVSNAGNTAMWGAIAGGGVGGIAGAGVGLASAMLEYGVSAYYNPKIQELQDKGNRLQADSLSIASQRLVDIVRAVNDNTYQLIRFDIDTDSANRFNNDVNLNGWYFDEIISNAENLLSTGALKGDFEIIGNCPLSAKISISEDIRNGIRTVII